jgi:hypothetical protein
LMKSLTLQKPIPKPYLNLLTILKYHYVLDLQSLNRQEVYLKRVKEII